MGGMPVRAGRGGLGPAPAEVVVTGTDLAGRRVRYSRTGLVARVLAHEIDHLAARLYVDLFLPRPSLRRTPSRRDP